MKRAPNDLFRLQLRASGRVYTAIPVIVSPLLRKRERGRGWSYSKPLDARGVARVIRQEISPIVDRNLEACLVDSALCSLKLKSLLPKSFRKQHGKQLEDDDRVTPLLLGHFGAGLPTDQVFCCAL